MDKSSVFLAKIPIRHDITFPVLVLECSKPCEVCIVHITIWSDSFVLLVPVSIWKLHLWRGQDSHYASLCCCRSLDWQVTVLFSGKDKAVWDGKASSLLGAGRSMKLKTKLPKETRWLGNGSMRSCCFWESSILTWRWGRFLLVNTQHASREETQWGNSAVNSTEG